MDAGKELAKMFGVPEDEARKAVLAEADSIRNDPFRASHERKPSYETAVRFAYERIMDWLRNGHEYMVKLDWEDLSRFSLSHRQACVWAVLKSKAKAEMGGNLQ